MSTCSRLTVIPAIVVVSLLAACSGGSNDAGSDDASTPSAESIQPGQPVAIEMHDIGFGTAALSVAANTEVEFVFTNTGKIPHDAFIGDHAAQLEHDAEMAAMATATTMAGMDGHGDHGADGSALTVQPGESGSLTYTFDTPGTYEIGCHQPGHYAAGMTITVIVT